MNYKSKSPFSSSCHSKYTKQFSQKDTNANQTRAYHLRWWYRGGVTLLCRLCVVSILPSQYLHYSFIATFCINMLACFGIGLCVAMIKGQDSLLFVFLTIGLLGGFSTFSTFSLEVLKLLQNHCVLTAMLYMLLSNICGILCVYLGYVFKG